jgi:hypothetical protein
MIKAPKLPPKPNKAFLSSGLENVIEKMRDG